MQRREFVAGALLAALASTYICSHARASDPKQGCRKASAGDADWRTLIRETSGQKEVDAFCATWSKRLVEALAVRSGFCFYDDADGPNAIATPDALFPDGPDGTVMFGLALIQHEIGPRPTWATQETTLPYAHTQPRLLIILAHEFGHIYQFKNGWGVDGPWQLEPQADFMAGWLLGRVMNILTPQEHGTFTTAMLTSMNQEEAVEAIFKKGDTLFDDPSHHGQPEFRAAMVRAGFDASTLDHRAAFDKGLSMAGVPNWLFKK